MSTGGFILAHLVSSLVHASACRPKHFDLFSIFKPICAGFSPHSRCAACAQNHLEASRAPTPSLTLIKDTSIQSLVLHQWCMTGYGVLWLRMSGVQVCMHVHPVNVRLGMTQREQHIETCKYINLLCCSIVLRTRSAVPGMCTNVNF